MDPLSSRVELVCTDLSTWSDDHPFDAVVSCNALVYHEIDIPAVYARYGGMLRPGGLLLNSTVAFTGQDRVVEVVAPRLSPEDAEQHSSEVIDFVRGAGERISHLGKGSLVSLLPTADHIALMDRAGLIGGCPWRFLSQVIVAGARPR